MRVNRNIFTIFSYLFKKYEYICNSISKSKQMKRILFSFLLLLGIMPAVADTFKATTPEISFTGRTLANADGSVSFDWVGVYMQTTFTGTSVSVVISDTGTSYYNIFIDSQLKEKIKITGTEKQTVVLAKGLKKGQHALRLQKCTEGQYGCATVYSLITDKGGKLGSVAPCDRFIAVFGDSYTCGYGTEAKAAEEHFSIDTENCNKAYGCLVAKYFGADYMLTAHSGQGMCHDWGDTLQVSSENMWTRFGQMFDSQKEPAFDFSKRRPDIVLINLGTNDWGAGWLPSIEQYDGNYVKMLQQIQKEWPDVPVLCITPHSANPFLLTALEELRKMVKDMPQVHFAQPMPNIIVYGYDYGADWHPNYRGQRKIALTLIPQISAITGWDIREIENE